MSTPKKDTNKKQKAPAPQPLPVALSPNHASLATKPARKISYARAKVRLIQRYGYKEDELDALFKKEEDLVVFYKDVASRKTDKETEDEIGWDQTDSIDAPASEKDRLAHNRLTEQKARFAAATGKPLDTVNLPTSATESRIEPILSLDEFIKAGDDLANLLDEPDSEEGGTEK